MALTAFFFYLFAILAVLAGAMVIVAKNPVHAVLFLILAFFNAAGLFVLLGAEFLAMLLVIVYVGAVAVLFLFVVMMLDVDFAELRAGFIKNAPLGLIVGGILLAELVMVLGFQVIKPGLSGKAAAPIATGVSNTAALGQILYTKYVYFFQAAGLILLVAMIGAIVLTLRHKEGVKRQSISAQNARSKATAMDVVKVPSGGYAIPEAKAQATRAPEARG
jgi:NADH-quinone oxidoreductase subunit J